MVRLGFRGSFTNARVFASRDTPSMRKPAPEAGFQRLRGKDSNLDYLIQSQASYH